MEKIRASLTRLVEFFTITIWKTRRNERSAIQWLLIRLLRTVILAVKGFARHQGALRASALTFFSLLSLVPVAAMAFGIAKGFGFERRLQQELLDNFPPSRKWSSRSSDSPRICWTTPKAASSPVSASSSCSGR
jgi:membrane protein